MKNQTSTPKQTDAALRTSEEQFHTIFEAAPIPMVISRASDGVILQANAHLGPFFGLATEELIGRKTPDFYYDPADRARMLERLQKNGELSDYEVRAQKADGTPFWVLSSIRSIKLNGESVLLAGFHDITARKSAEEEVRRLNEELEQRVAARTAEWRESQEQFQQIAENINEVLWLESLDDKRLLYVSPVFDKIWGFSHQKLFQQPLALLEAVHPEDRDRFKAHLGKQRRGEIAETEYRIVQPDNSMRWIWDRGFPIRNGDGHIYRTVGLAQDITERKQAEEALRRRNEQIIRHQAALLKLARLDDADLAAKQKKILEVAARTLEVERCSAWLFNADRSEIICQDLYLCSNNVHESGLRLQAQQYPGYFRALTTGLAIPAHDARQDPRTAEFTEDYLKPLGITSMLDVSIWLHAKVAGVVCHEHTGARREWTPEEEEFATSIAELFSLALEETELKLAAEALYRSKMRYRSLVHDIEGIVWEADPENLRMTFASDQVERLLGYPWQQWIEEPTFWQDHIFPEDLAAAIASRQKAIAERKTQEIEYRMCAAGGRVVWLRDIVSGFTAEGQAHMLRGVMVDITDRKHMEEQIRQYTQELEKLVEQRTAQIQELERQRAESEKLAAAGRMAARIAHEINNPLAGILNSFTLVKDAVPETHRYYSYVSRIENEIDRIAGIVRQMFDLYRPEKESVREFRLNETISDVIALLQAGAYERSVILESDTSRAAVAVTLSEGLLRQILYNLILNAIEASVSGGVVKIDAAIENQALHLTVADQGAGISEAAGAHIFEPFFTTKSGDHTGGLGLGLSITQSIVQSMKGTIGFESQVGKGTVFKIALPLALNIGMNDDEVEG